MTILKNSTLPNHGGTKFTTTRDTLCNEKNSYFSGLFSEYGQWETDEDGEYFIDRDGKLFHIILNHLRGMDMSELIKGLSKVKLIHLKSDVQYYIIHSLYDTLELAESEVEVFDKFVSASWDQTIKIWDVTTGQCLQSLTGHTDYVWCLLTVSEDILVSGSEDQTIKIWDVKTGECLHSLTGHKDSVNCMTCL